MANTPLLGTGVGSAVVPGSSTANYATHYDIFGAGGFRCVTTLQRDAIATDSAAGLHFDGLGSGQRRVGMVALVVDNPEDMAAWKAYRLVMPAGWASLSDSAKITALADNANWHEWVMGGGGTAPGITPITYAALSAALVSNGGAGSLAVGRYLLTDFQTTFPIGDAGDLLSGAVEALILTAVAPNQLLPTAASLNYPNDVVYYSPENGNANWPWATKGYITRRIDAVRQNDLPIDFRTVKFRRWQRPQTQDEIDNSIPPLFYILTDNGQVHQDNFLFNPAAYANGQIYQNTFTNISGQTPFFAFNTTTTEQSNLHGNQFTASAFSQNTLDASGYVNNVVTGGSISRNAFGYVSANVISLGGINDNYLQQGSIQSNVVIGAGARISSNIFAPPGGGLYLITRNNLFGTSSIANYNPATAGQKVGNTAFDTPNIPTDTRTAGVYMSGRRIDLQTIEYASVTFKQDAEYSTAQSDLFTFDATGMVLGVHVNISIGVGQLAFTIPAGPYFLDSGAYVAGMRHRYEFIVRADGLVHYSIQSY